MITVSQFKTRIAPKLHGTTLAKIDAINEKLQESAGNFFSNVRPYSVIRSSRIENAIYDKVYNYACQDDLEVDGVIDIRPIGPRSTKDQVLGSFSQQFDIRKPENSFYVEFINGVKTLRLSKNLTPRSVLHECNSLTLDGTVTGSGDVTDLDIDYLDYVSGSSSIKFNLSGATGQGIITFALASSLDLSDLKDLGAFFHWLKFPLASALTSVRIRVGSGASHYKEVTVTAAHDRAFESNAWLLLRYLMSSATTTGTPDFDALNYVQIAINYTSGTARNDVKIDNITAALGQAYEVVYYSNRMFTDTTSTTWKETPTLDTDIIRLDGANDVNALMYEFMLTLQQELKGKNMAADFTYFRTQLFGTQKKMGLYERLQEKYPDQAVVRQVEYYRFGSLDGRG